MKPKLLTIVVAISAAWCAAPTHAQSFGEGMANGAAAGNSWLNAYYTAQDRYRAQQREQALEQREQELKEREAAAAEMEQINRRIEEDRLKLQAQDEQAKQHKAQYGW